MINKDDILRGMADRQVKELLEESMLLRCHYESDSTVTRTDVLLLQFAVELEEAAKAIVFDCADRKLITWDDYKVIRNIIDHIGTGERMEDMVW